MPQLVPGAPMTESLTSELVSEVASVRERAPSLEIVCPPLRPNTRLAIATILSVQDVAPEKSAMLRTSVFRALWQDGLDISSPGVLAELLRRAGLDQRDLPGPYFESAAECFGEWDRANYRRIPVMRAPTGATYLGLGDETALNLYMGSALFDITRDGSCSPR